MSLHLSQSTSLRLATFTVFYIGQGVPIGLFTIALPAWLAEQGASAAQVGALVAITGLPWAFKLIAGPFMDRFAFPAMGRRRPWVMAAQAALCLALLGLTTITEPLSQLQLLIGIGVIVNSFAALQDVAVDGMAIDVLPAEERGRANALMAFGQVVGYSGSGAVGGWLLSQFGLGVAGLAAALFVAVIFTVSTVVRERLGERLLPWSEGVAAAVDTAVDRSFAEIFRNLLRVVLLPMSLLLIAVELLSRMAAGISLGLLPVLAVQDLGYSSQDYAYWFGIFGGAAAGVGIFFGPMIDRFGAHRLLAAALLGSAAVAVGFALSTSYWGNDSFVLAMLAASLVFSQAFFVSMIALFMGICWTRVAATQFAIYMSLANLSRSLGAAVYALLAVQLSSAEMLYLMAFFLIAGALLLSRYDAPAHSARLAELEQSDETQPTRQGA
jgi:PAT family beta-lactamase induction signal transducer AmpG